MLITRLIGGARDSVIFNRELWLRSFLAQNRNFYS